MTLQEYSKNFDVLEVEKFIQQHHLETLKFKQQLWHTYYGVTELVKCQHCLKKLVKWVSLNQGYKKYCSNRCSYASGDRVKKAKITNLKRYGDTSTFRVFKEKSLKKVKEKYGVKNVMQSKEIQQKAKQKILEKYGVENVFQNTNVKDKIKRTLLNKYQVDHPSKSQEILNLKADNFLKTYGVNNVFELEHIKEAAKKSITKEVMDKKVNNNYKKLKLQIFKNYNLNILKIDVNRQIHIQCHDCQREYQISNFLLHQRVFRDDLKNPCTICRDPKIKNISYQEQEIASFIRSLGYEIIIRDRQILKPKELDIYISSLNLGIEYNGAYWHSDNLKIENDVMLKWQLCQQKNIKLINIYELDWLKNKEDIKKKIQQVLKNGYLEGSGLFDLSYPYNPKYKIKKFLNDDHWLLNIKNSNHTSKIWKCDSVILD
jgi:hypothetical protein